MSETQKQFEIVPDPVEQETEHSLVYSRLSREAQVLEEAIGRHSDDHLVDRDVLELALLARKSTLAVLELHDDDPQQALKALKIDRQYAKAKDQPVDGFNYQINLIGRANDERYRGPEYLVSDLQAGKRNPLEGEQGKVARIGDLTLKAARKLAGKVDNRQSQLPFDLIKAHRDLTPQRTFHERSIKRSEVDKDLKKYVQARPVHLHIIN
jgi:hypothetical protein